MAYQQVLCTLQLLSFDEMALSLQLDDFQPEDAMAKAFPSNHTLPVVKRCDDARAEKQRESVCIVIGSTSQMV